MSTPNALAANAAMLRTVALQIDVAIVNNATVPSYVKDAAKGFTDSIRRYITEELEKTNGDAAKPANE